MEMNDKVDSSLLANIEEKISQYENDRYQLEKLINVRKLELIQLENLLQVTSSSLGVQKSLLDAIKCKKCCSTITTDKESQTETALSQPTLSAPPPVSSLNVAEILRKIGNIKPPESPKICSQEVKIEKALQSTGVWKSPSKIKPIETVTTKPLITQPRQPQTTIHAGGKSSTISRISNVLKLCAKRNEPKKVAQGFPNRIRDPAIVDVNSRLVEMHRNVAETDKHLDYNSVNEWTVVQLGPNRRLERLMEKRKRNKLDQLKQRQPQCVKLISQRPDLVTNLGLLMNYDLIRHVDCKTKKARRPRRDKSDKSKPKTSIQHQKADEKKDCVSMEDIMFDMIDNELNCKPSEAAIVDISSPSDKRMNDNEDDDLYGDLNGPSVNLDLNLLEDGEVDEELEKPTTKDNDSEKVVTMVTIKKIDENVQKSVPKSRDTDKTVVKKLRTNASESRTTTPPPLMSKENQNKHHHSNHRQHHHHQSDAYRNRHDNSRHRRSRSRSRSRPRSKQSSRVKSRSRSGSRRRESSPPRKQQHYQTSSSSKYHRNEREVHKRKRSD